MSNIMVMAFSPQNIVDCLLKKGLQSRVTGTPGPPSLRPCVGVSQRVSGDTATIGKFRAKITRSGRIVRRSSVVPRQPLTD